MTYYKKFGSIVCPICGDDVGIRFLFRPSPNSAPPVYGFKLFKEKHECDKEILIERRKKRMKLDEGFYK